MKNSFLLRYFNGRIVFFHHYLPFLIPISIYIAFEYLFTLFYAENILIVRLVALAVALAFLLTVNNKKGYFKGKSLSLLLTITLTPFIIYFLMEGFELWFVKNIIDFVAIISMILFCLSQSLFGGCIMDRFENYLAKSYQSKDVAHFHLYGGESINHVILRVIYLILGLFFVWAFLIFLGLNIRAI